METKNNLINREMKKLQINQKKTILKTKKEKMK